MSVLTSPAKKKRNDPIEKMRKDNRKHSGFVVLFVVFGLLKIGSAEVRNPVPEELQYLEEPDRGEWQMPERIIETLGLRKSDVVADVGALSNLTAGTSLSLHAIITVRPN